MDALIEADRLILNGGYLRLQESNYLLIWPHGFSLRTVGDSIQVIDDNGRVVARAGDRIKVGGGGVAAEIARKYSAQSLPDDATGPYWIVAETVEVVEDE
jgi:hypothetical protein